MPSCPLYLHKSPGVAIAEVTPDTSPLGCSQGIGDENAVSEERL